MPTLFELARHLNAVLEGDCDVVVTRTASLESAQPGDLAFCNQRKLAQLLTKTKASAVIISEDLKAFCSTNAIIGNNPYALYAKAAQFLNPPVVPFEGVHSSVLSESELPSDIAVDAFVKIGKNVRLGENVAIFSGCVIADNVQIDDGCVLYPNVVVYKNCILGKRCILHAGAVIGADGFGFAPEGASWVKIPQLGAVVLGDDVEIGANSTIDCGTFENTTIASGCKIDNLVHIAHNCHIGENTVMAACTGVAGSVTMGKHCMLGGAAMVSGHLCLGDNVVISGGSLVMKSITKPGRYTSVFPLDSHENWIENAAHIRRLDRLAQKIKRLEKNLEELAKKS